MRLVPPEERHIVAEERGLAHGLALRQKVKAEHGGQEGESEHTLGKHFVRHIDENIFLRQRCFFPSVFNSFCNGCTQLL